MAITVKEALEARKKKKEEEEKKKISVSDALELRKNRIETDLQSTMSSLQEDLSREYDTFKNLGELSFGTDLKSVLDSTNESRINLGNLRIKVDAYRKYLGDDKADEILSYIDQMKGGYNSYLSNAEIYSTFKNKAEYDQWISDSEEYEKKKTADTYALEKEADDLESKYDQFFNPNSLKYTGLPDFKYYTDPSGKSTGVPRPVGDIDKETQKYLKQQTGYSTKEELEAAISEKQRYTKQAKRIQEGIRLSGVADAESEFYDPEFDSFDDYNGTSPESVYDSKDNLYEYVNNYDDFRSKYKRHHTTMSSDNPFSDGVSSYEEKGYDFLTEQEVAIFNYYYAKDGKKAAEKYLDSIQESLVYRKANDKFKDFEGNTISELLFAIPAGVDQFESGIKNLFNTDDYIPVSDTQALSQMVREDLSDDGFKLPEFLGGSSLGQVAYDITNTTSNMLPSIIVGTATGSAAGTVLLGASAAGNAYQEMINLGYDKGQARMYSTLVGASEAGLEYLLGGISALGGKATGGVVTKLLSKIDNAYARAAIRLGGSMLSEGFEEGLQEYLEPWFKSIAFNTDYEAANLDEILYSGLLGALSAFGLEGTHVISSELATYSKGKNLKTDGKVDRLVELGKTFPADTVAYQIANKVNKDTGAYTIGRLLNEVGASLSEANISDITNALVERGIDQSQAATVAKWMDNTVNGAKLTYRQRSALENNPVLADVLYGTIIQPNSTVMQRNQAVAKLNGREISTGIDRQALEESQTPEAISQAVTQKLADKQAMAEALVRGANPRSGLSAEQISEIDAFATKSRTTIPEANYQDVGQSVSSKPSSAKIADITDKVSDTESTFVKSTGEEVSISKIASIDAKSKTMKLELSNGTVVDSSDISYGDENQALLYESVLLMGYDAHTANAIVQGYTASSPTSVEDYLIGTTEAFNYGWGHIPKKARGGKGYNKLTKAERIYAVKLGEDARSADDTAREARVSQNQTSTSKKKAKGGYGARLSVNKNTVPDRVKKSVKALDEVAKALKLNIIIADLGGNSYGFYRRSTNELFVDVNAGGNGKNTLLFTASHELIHYVRNWSPHKFTVLADFLMEQYAAKGENIDALIQAEIDKAYKATRGKHQMTYNEAYEEVVAQAMQRFLTDSNFIERLASLQKKDANLAKRLISKLKEILNSIRAAYQGMDTNDRASQAVKEMGEAIDELYAKMEEGLIAASEASQGIGARSLEDFSEAKNTNGEDLFQYKAMEADEDTYRQMLKKHGIMSEKDINKLFSTIDKALVIIKNNLEVLDYAWEADIDDRSFSPVKPNSDSLYKVSLDFSTLCRKRILQQVIQTQLQDALKKPLSREESIAIRDELMKIQEEGRQIEIACALCYVESARMKSPAQIKKFLKNRESVIKEFIAFKAGGDIKQKIAQAEADARKRLGVGNASLKSMPKKVADQIRAAKKEAKKSYAPTAEEQKLIDAALSMSVSDFTSPEGLGNLAKNYPVLFDAYTSFIRNATKSKGIEKDTWWRAGDSNSIGDTLIANMNRENGLRSQSWSDFQVIHLLDYIASTIELSTRNAKEQAYSKVPDYIELMGNTGAMLNMSLIPMAQFNGKLEYDSVEGMAYKKAIELRDKYHATAGTICIGISNEQIRMLLDDSTIDYVIPYHKSGMAAHIRKLMHIPTWSEYEDYQNEDKLSRDEAQKQAKKYGVTLLSESDPNYQMHTAFSEWFDIEEARQIAKQENAFPTDASLQKKLGVMYGGYMAMRNAANNYLKLCAERGLSPKFSHENANFTEEANYWKLIIDRKMVDNVTGEIIEQQAIKPIFDESEVLRILNDELKRYPEVKADQDYATRTVVEKFLSGKMNDRLDADTVAAIMQKPVDNITTTNIVASEDDVKNQYVDISQQLQDWMEGNGKAYGEYNGRYFDLGTTPDILLKHGAKKSRLIMHDDVIIKVTGGKHSIALDEIARLPVELNDPILLFKGSVPRSFVALTEMVDKNGYDVIVAIHLDRYQDRIRVNEIRSLYSKTDRYDNNRIEEYVYAQIEEGNLLDASEKKAPNWFTSRGLQLPKLVQTILDANRIVSQKPNSVKTNRKISETLNNANAEIGEFGEVSATAESTDIVNTEDLKSQYIDTDETYSYIGKEVLGYNEGNRKPDLTLVEVVNERTGLTETTIKFYGEKPKNYVPKKIAYCYKLFEQHPDGTLHALFAGASNATSIGEWVYSQGFPYTDSGVKGMNLRERYGWHLSAGLPSAPHLMSSKAFERGYPSKNSYGHPKGSKRVWVRMAYDATTDFNSIADSTRKGDIFGLIPFGGYYAFKENNQSEWVISSAVKIDKILTEDERQQILKEAGYDEYEAWRRKYRATEAEKAEAKRKSIENKKAKDKAAKAGLNYLSESSKAMREAIKSRIIDNPELDDVSHQYIDSDTDYAPTFYSQMGKVISEMKQNKIGANDVVRYLTDSKRGVKAEEIKWSGIEGFLEGKKSVTKAELQEFIAASMLQIEEETLDNKDRPYTEDQQKRLNEYEAKRDEVAKRLADEWKKITGDEFPIRNAGAGLESSVTQTILEANQEYKKAAFEGRLLAKLREDLKEVIANNDDFGFDSWKDALRSIHRHRRDFINSYEMTTKDKAVIVKYCNALNAYNELPNKITDADTDRLRSIAREADPWNRKIMEVRHEHNEYEAKYMTNWREYSLEGGKNYREILFRIPNSNYTNEAMITHWKERKGVLAHARIQDFDVDGKKMLFIEEIQSDWHNAGRKDGYRDPGAEDKYTLSKKMEKFQEEFFESPTAKMFEERISAVGYEGAGVSMMLNYLLDETDYTLDVLSRKGVSFTDSEKSEIDKYVREYEELHNQWENAPGDLTAPDAPFKDTYHEYVMKRLLREAAENGYDSIGWTTAETQDERWKNNLPHEEGTGKSGFLKGYTVEYDQGIPKFLRKHGRQWGAKVGSTTLPNGTEVWSMDITDSMKNSVLYDGQVMYQYADADAIDNRTLLARSLESAAKTELEKQKIKEYQSKIERINAEEKKLRELRGQIKEISFSKGARDTEKLKKLQFEANQAANRINVYDKQLLSLEATKPIKDVLQREKDLVRKKMDKERKEAVNAARQKGMETIRELMDRHKESRQKAIEGRDKTVMRHKIKGIVNELDTLLRKPTAKKHIKEELRAEVADALLAINMDTVGADERVARYNEMIAKAKDPDIIAELVKSRDNIQLQGDNLKEKLTALQNAYEKIKASEDIELSMSYQEVVRNSIKNVTDNVGNTSIRNMSLEQLEMVYDLFSMIRKTIRNANKAFNEQKGQTIMQMAEAVNDQVRTVGGQTYKRNAIVAALQRAGWTLLKPYTAFRTIGSVTLTNLYKELREGEDTFYGDVKEAQEFIEDQYEKLGYKSWDMKQTKSFTAKSGKSFDLTLEQMMTLYAYSRREQAHKHIIDGGIVFEDAMVVEKNKLGVPIKYEVTTKDAFNLSEETFSEICNSLSAEQKAFVDAMQEYLSKTMGAKGNEVSMELLGVKLFKEEFYLPIKSSQEYMNFSAEEAGEVKLKSPAFSKETVQHANNPIVLHNFTDLWSEHINDMSMYHAFVLALEDFTRVYNYKSKTDANLETMSTKASLDTAFPGATKYINEFLKDMNGGVRSETVGWAEKLTSLAKKGAVLGSLSVAIQQPSAVMRAMAFVNPKHFIATTPKSLNLVKHKQDWAELKKYAPIAGIKEMGKFDVGMGQGTVDWIKSNKTLMNKAEDFLSAGPALMDEITWVSIWNAAKRETVSNNKNLRPDSEELLKLAGERFTDVISLSQVYDSVFSRSDIMRNKSWIAKATTAFMAEPMTTLNMMIDAFVQGKRSGNFKGFVKTAAPTAGAIVAAYVLNAALKSIVTAARDDDEDESLREKYLEHFVGDFKDSLNPLTLVPFAKDVVSIFQGYDVERMDMSLVSDLYKAIEAFDSDNKTMYEKWSGLIGATSAFFGIPVKNVEREVRAVINVFFGERESATKQGLLDAISEGWTGESKSNGQQLYEAMLSGDAAHIERIEGRFKDEDAINTALKKALRENDSRIKKAAMELRGGNFGGYSNYVETIASEGNFDKDLIAVAIRSEQSYFDKKISEASEAKTNGDEEEYKKLVRELRDSYRGIYSQDEIVNLIKTYEPDADDSADDEDDSKETSIYKASDINAALENGDTSAALEVIDDLVEVKTNNYIAEGEKKKDAEKKAKSSVRSSLTSYWKPLYLEAYKSKNNAEMTRIRKLLKATKLYDDVVETCQDWVKQSKKSN